MEQRKRKSWEELSDKDKALLNDTGVEYYVKEALMRGGVIVLEDLPTELEEPELPESCGQAYKITASYGTGIYFKTIGEAEQVVELCHCALNVNTEYTDKGSLKCIDGEQEVDIKGTKLYTKKDIAEYMVLYKSYEAAIEERRMLEKEHEERQEIVKEIADPIRQSVQDADDKKQKAKEDAKILVEYTGMCQGKKDVAVKFFLKVRTQDDLNNINYWAEDK